MALTKVPYTNGVTVIGAENLNNIQDAIIALQNGGAISDDLKQALLQIAQKVAYIDDQGATYYQDLYDALYPPKTAVSISAVFTQGSTVVYDNASLNSLKTMLQVTVTYDDNSTEILSDTAYTLSGTLTPGTSTVTVTYNSLTTTFTVNVTAAPTLSSISAVYTQTGTVYDTDTLDSLKPDLVVTATYSDSSTATVAAADYTLSGTLTAGTSAITVSYGDKTTSFSVTVTAYYSQLSYIQADGDSYIDIGYDPNQNTKIVLDYMSLKASGVSFQSPIGVTAFPNQGTGKSFFMYIASANGVTVSVSRYSNQRNNVLTVNNGDRKVFSLSNTDFSVDGTSYGAPQSEANKELDSSIGYYFYVFARKMTDAVTAKATGRVYELSIYESDSLVKHYIPVKRNTDNAYGLLETVGNTFYGNIGSGSLTGA